MALDFKEIPVANKGGGKQDTFELFARDVLSYLGYRIVEDPDRGADGKRDLIIDEVLQGVNSEHTIRWLVSCKHYAHSGKSVSDTDEINITERLAQHHCHGFMGFYSTLASSGLSGVLSGQPWHYVFDSQKIESYILRDLEGQRIAARYFPVSFRNYLIENPTPSNVFSELKPLECEFCHKNLLLDTEHGNYILMRKDEGEDANGFPIISKKYHKLAFACKDHDRQISEKYYHDGYHDEWGDIDDLCNPYIWISKVMAFVNGIQHDQDMTDEAFEQFKGMLLRTYPYICRHLTTKEKERAIHLAMYDLV